METKMKLPEDFKKKWVDALRSGKYKQGKGMLYNGSNDSYCCLGVAAEVCGLDMVLHGEHAAIPNIRTQEIMKVDFKVPTEFANNQGLQNVLWRMNDEKDNTFEEIADYIEQNL